MLAGKLKECKLILSITVQKLFSISYIIYIIQNKNTKTNTQAQGAKMTNSITQTANILAFIETFKAKYNVRFTPKQLEALDYVLGFYGDGPDSLNWFVKDGHEPMTELEAIFGLYAITKKDLEIGNKPYILEYNDIDTSDRENIRDAVLQARGNTQTENLLCVKQILCFQKLQKEDTFMAEWKAAAAIEPFTGAIRYVWSKVGPSSLQNLFNA
tara:strand:+ start:477 stop:1115 length:639 start_codon:yes stop_codon:yes gene_type:complete